MPRRIIDLSVTLADRPTSPPHHRPKIEYTGHDQSFEMFSKLFDGLRPESLPEGKAWASEMVTLTTHAVEIGALGIDAAIGRTLAPGAALTLTRADLPALGPHALVGSALVTASVSSRYNPDGAPFMARAEGRATLLLASETRRVWLPVVAAGEW